MDDVLFVSAVISSTVVIFMSARYIYTTWQHLEKNWPHK